MFNPYVLTYIEQSRLCLLSANAKKGYNTLETYVMFSESTTAVHSKGPGDRGA